MLIHQPDLHTSGFYIRAAFCTELSIYWAGVSDLFLKFTSCLLYLLYTHTHTHTGSSVTVTHSCSFSPSPLLCCVFRHRRTLPLLSLNLRIFPRNSFYIPFSQVFSLPVMIMAENCQCLMNGWRLDTGSEISL